jgi:hypothetical protein
VLSNSEKETLLRELADEFGYELMSKVANYSFINRRGTFDHEGKLIPNSDFWVKTTQRNRLPVR